MTTRAPRWLGRVLLVALGAAACLALCVGVFWYFRLALPPERDALPHVNAMMAEASGGVDLDSDDNAVTHLRRMYDRTLGVTRMLGPSGAPSGNDLYQEWRDRRQDDSLKNLTLGAWDDPRHDAAKGLLPRLRPVLDALDRASDAPGYRVEYTSSGDIFAPARPSGPTSSIDILLPHISEWRALGTLNAAAMRASANEGDWDDAARRVRTGVRFARHVWSEVFIINPVVAMSVEELVLHEVRFAAFEHDIPADALREMIRAIEDAGGPVSFEPALRAEVITLPDIVREKTLHIAGGSPRSLEHWVRRLREPSPRLAVRDGLAHYREAIEHERLSPAQRAATPLPTPRGAGANYVSSLLFFQMRDRLLTKRAATLAALRIALFRAERGRVPTTLDEAMTRERTLDPVSGEPFLYEVGADAAAYRLFAPPGATHVPVHERVMTARRVPLPSP